MERIDHHVHFELPYTLDNLLPYIERAKALQLDELHILDHSHRFVEFKSVYEEIMSDTTLEGKWIARKFKSSIYDYIEFIKLVKNQDFGIPIKFGIEVCYFENKEQEIKHVLELYPFDFVIGSVHFIDGFGYDLDNQDYSNVNIDELYKQYFELEIAAIKSELFNIIGHPDALKLCGINPTIDLYDYYDALVNEASIYNVSLDMNSGLYYRYGVNHLGMDTQLIKLAKLYDASLVPSSDAHKYSDLGNHMDCMLRMCDKQTTSIECSDNVYITDDFNSFEVYSKNNGKLVDTISFKPHTQKGSVMLELHDILSDIKEFFAYMHEYYHVEHVVAISNEEKSIYEALGMEKIYSKESINYYNYSF